MIQNKRFNNQQKYSPIPAVISILAFGFISMTLVGCSGHRLEDAKFWQRSSTSSALYMRGPKAQQQLHKDIANCTHHINELENLGAIRESIPPHYAHGNRLEPRTAAKTQLDKWDTPERDLSLIHI